jgi:hypothetical protein
MWDLTIDGVHTFFVGSGAALVSTELQRDQRHSMGNSGGDRDGNTIDAERGGPGRRWADDLLRDFPELQELERQTIESVGEPVPVLLLGDQMARAVVEGG